MMHPSRIKQKIASGETAFATTVHFAEPTIHEMVSSMGFDGIWMDLEHHRHSVERAADMMRAIRAGGPTDIIARPAKGEFMRMGRLLEIGAHGIMYPRCDDAAEAAEVVRWAKFAPLGQRGCDAAGADGDYMSRTLPEYIRRANENTFIIIQLEDPAAVDHAEAIASVDGVDMLMLGPGDMSVLIGEPGRMDHPVIVESRRRIADAASAAGKHWATTSPHIEFTRQMAEEGAALVFQGSDFTLLRQAMADLKADFSRR